MAIAGAIVGLGNPGREYEHTRHNCGFDVLTNLLHLAHEDGYVKSQNGAKFSCELWQVEGDFLEGGSWLLAKPQTYMNLSGHCVQPLLAWHKLKPSNLIVIHDELDIPVGQLRFKFGGGNAGHNGLKSINQELGTNDFYRLRVGIGRPTHKTEILNWVLGHPTGDEQTKLIYAQKEALEVLTTFTKKGLQEAVTWAKQCQG